MESDPRGFTGAMSSFFEDLGRKLGRAAVPTYRKSKWIWEGLTGTEGEAYEAEEKLGSTLAAELRLATEIFDAPKTVAWLRGICGRLDEAVEPSRFSYHCEVIGGAQPSAIALPGGYFFVSRSLIDFCEGSADEVAFVLAHETAHLVRRHTWDRMVQQSALRAASFAAGRAGVLSGWVRSQGLPMLRSAHSKSFEFTADEDGIGLVRAAGFNPAGAMSFLTRIEALGEDPDLLGEYFASHPSPRERMEQLSAVEN